MKNALLILLAVLLVLGGTCLIAFPFSVDYEELFDNDSSDSTDIPIKDDTDTPGEDNSDNTDTPPAGEEDENIDIPSEPETVNLWIGMETTVSDSEGNTSTYSYENVSLELNKEYTLTPTASGTYYLDKNYVAKEVDIDDNVYYDADGTNLLKLEDTQTVIFTESTSYFLYEESDLIGVKVIGAMSYDYYTGYTSASGNHGSEICYGTFTSLKNYPVRLSVSFDETVKSVSGSVQCTYMSKEDYLNCTNVSDVDTYNEIESITAAGGIIEFTPSDFAVIYYRSNSLSVTYKAISFTIVNQTSLDIKFDNQTVSAGNTFTFDCPAGISTTLYGGTSSVDGFHISLRTDPDDSDTQVALIDDTDACDYSFAPEDGVTYYAVEVPHL